MHTAPTVAYPVGRSGARTVGFAAAWWLAAAAVFAFVVADGASPRSLVAALLSVLAFARAWRQHRDAPVGQLAWDGVTWWWEPSGADRTEGQVTPCLDLQAVVLVHFVNGAGRGAWLWLERGAAPVFWGRLRCALMQALPLQDAPASALGVPAAPAVPARRSS